MSLVWMGGAGAVVVSRCWITAGSLLWEGDVVVGVRQRGDQYWSRFVVARGGGSVGEKIKYGCLDDAVR